MGPRALGVFRPSPRGAWKCTGFCREKNNGKGVKGAYPLGLIELSSECEIEKMQSIFAASPSGETTFHQNGWLEKNEVLRHERGGHPRNSTKRV